MIEVGIIDEVQNLLKNGATGNEKPLKSIGYSEVLQFIHGDISDQEELSERISISTRQLAKAQRTWFKKVDKIRYNPLCEWNSILATVEKHLEKNG